MKGEKNNNRKPKESEEKRYIIKEVLEDISREDKGLTLLTNPAGSGKSYETSLFIADQIINSDRKIYYITPRIKNLDDLYNGIISALDERGYSGLADEVVKVDSFRNSVINNSNLIVNKVTSKWKEAKELKRMIDMWMENISYTELRKSIEKTLFENNNNLENTFRKKLKIEFRKDYKNNSTEGQSEYEFMKNSKWSFIEELYPSSKTMEKKVFVMTSSKFFLKNDPIITQTYSFTEKEKIENSLVIVDEIDAIKSDILDNILNNNFENNIIDTFKIIQDQFQNIESMYYSPIKLTNSEDEIKWIQKESQRIKNKYFPNKWEIMCFDRNEKTGELKKLNIKTKIMNYQGISSYCDREAVYNYVPYIENNEDVPEEEKCNKILPKSVIKEGNYEKTYFISNFLQEITIFLKRTFRKLYDIAMKYMRCVNDGIKSNPDSNESFIKKENSITTLLGNLNIDDNNCERFANYIIEANEYRKYKLNFDVESLEDSIYAKGLYYTSISEYEKYKGSNILNNYEIPYTPELMLLDLVSKAHVIGLSATAEVNSLNNFNFDFIEESLAKINDNVKIHRLSDKNKRLLAKDYKDKTSGYEKINTLIKKIDVDSEGDINKDLTKLILGKEEVTKEDIMKIASIGIDDKEANSIIEEYTDIRVNLTNIVNNAKDYNYNHILYDYERIKKVWKYIDEVMEYYKNEKIISNGIIITEKLVRSLRNIDDTNNIYTIENIKLGAVYICINKFTCEDGTNESLNKRFEKANEIVENMFIKVDAQDLKNDNKMKDINNIIKDKFIENKPVFMITSYSSVSRGNNLQIEVGREKVEEFIEQGKLIKINDWEIKGKMDWDTIYIEKPSYVIPSLRNQFEGNDNIFKPISYKEKLRTFLVVEEIALRDSLNVNNKDEILGEIFDSFENNYKYFPYYDSLYGFETVKRDYSILIYQTIGRISRTNLKKRYNAIFYDSEIIDSIEYRKEYLNIPIITNEFDKFTEDISDEIEKRLKSLEDNRNPNQEDKNRRMHGAIENILIEGKNGWSTELQEFWKALRVFVLKNPVITKKGLKEAEEYFKQFKVINRIGFDIKDAYLKFSKSKQKYFYGLKSGENIKLNDFEYVLISKEDKSIDKPGKVYKFEVSRDDCRLSMLLNNKYIRDYWKSKEYNMHWNVEKGEKIYGILCPVIYNNIYKGVVGEEILKAVFESINIECEEITDSASYEKFDFIISKDKKKIYVDAKNFSEVSFYKEYANKDLENKVKNKIKSLGIEQAMVINIVDDSGSRKIVDKEKRVYIPGIFKSRYLNDCSLIRDNDFDDNSKSVLDKIEEIIISR